jgi:hypothetical protein
MTKTPVDKVDNDMDQGWGSETTNTAEIDTPTTKEEAELNDSKPGDGNPAKKKQKRGVLQFGDDDDDDDDIDGIEKPKFTQDETEMVDEGGIYSEKSAAAKEISRQIEVTVHRIFGRQKEQNDAKRLADLQRYKEHEERVRRMEIMMLTSHEQMTGFMGALTRAIQHRGGPLEPQIASLTAPGIKNGGPLAEQVPDESGVGGVGVSGSTKKDMDENKTADPIEFEKSKIDEQAVVSESEEKKTEQQMARDRTMSWKTRLTWNQWT